MKIRHTQRHNSMLPSLKGLKILEAMILNLKKIMSIIDFLGPNLWIQNVKLTWISQVVFIDDTL